jgi:hypothetical protein
MALAACALWLAGVEALPALHEALHAQLAPHHHAGDAIVTVSLDDTTHRHPDGTIHFVTPRSRSGHTPSRDGQSHASDLAGHAAGLAHHAAALAPVPPPVTQPLPIDRRPRRVALAIAVALTSHGPPPATARGPPNLA